MYRKDLFAKAGLTMPQRPNWQQVARLAAKLHDPRHGVAGICLRGGPGWGNLLMPLNTVILTFGGRWYDEHWNPRLTSPKRRRRSASTWTWSACTANLGRPRLDPPSA